MPVEIQAKSALVEVTLLAVKPAGSEHDGHAFTPLTLFGVDEPTLAYE